ncbi:SusC/RagA family TonB-linked outer membrane protein [Bacteroides ovatus]|uniref:SusC/RagA family TonB-linked outer membrane protein n=1 Tax=Bacteroides ovatus TaxID=28116 RepID=UPI0018A11F48|nr:TonB-dependent receptor [Bacteroides ovatus]
MRHRLMILCFIIFCPFILYGQRISISGNVKDKNGDPLIGVTVQVKGTNSGTITDFDGNYLLPNVSKKSILAFSYIGMVTQEIEVNGKSSINVVLRDDSELLEEVVVVGYSTQKKVSVTGAVAAISNDQIKQSPSANLVGSLTGKLPGLSIMQNSGQPGEEDFQLRLRGASTMNGQSPLILVDGVPREDLSLLDPNEIAAISILKDASATAVFGVRGANGVILVTTKIGEQEKPSLSVSAEYGIQEFTKNYEMMDSWRYATLYNQALVNDGLPIKYSDRQIQLYKDGTNPYYANTDWFDVMFKDRAVMSRYNANLSGSSKRVKYFVNVGMLNQGGMMNTESRSKLGYDPQFKLNRYNFRSNLDIRVVDWIKADLKIAGYIDKVGRPGSAASDQFQFFRKIYTMSPTVPVFPDESFGIPMDALVSTYDSSPYGELNYLGYQTQDKSKLNTSLGFDFDLNKFVKGLSTKVLLAYDVNANSIIKGTKTGYNVYQLSILEQKDENGNIEDVYSLTSQNEYQKYQLSLNKSYSFSYSLNFQWIVNYMRDFGKNNVGTMFVFQKDNSEAASGTSIDLLPYNRLGFAGRLTYRYADRYMGEFNIGYNGSEQFAKGKRFGVFPAFSLGWLVSNEDFMKDIKAISNLKLRASFGKVGNDKIGNQRFLYLDNNTIVNRPPTIFYDTVLGNAQMVQEKLIGNPDLTWEIAYKQNYGIDLGLFNNNLTVTFDYFRENRKNILITRNTVPSILGNFQSVMPKANFGEVFNHGFELDIFYNKKVNKDWSYSIRGMFNFARNKIIFKDELNLGDDYYCPYRGQGYSMGQNFGYLIDWDSPGHGYFLVKEEIADYPEYSGIKPRVGDFVYKDMNDDDVIDEKDYAPIGKPSLPEFNYSLTLGFSYKGLDFSALLYGIGNSYNNYKGAMGIDETKSVFQNHHLNAWSQERYEQGKEISYPALTTSGSSSLGHNDYFIRNRAFLRLKNLEIGYVLPKKLTKKIGISKLRFYANGQNLLTFDNLPFESVDPEQKTTSSVLPVLKVINFGANINF